MLAAAFLSLAGVVSAATSSTNWQNTTGTSSEAFPTAVGNLGPYTYGAPPFLAQEDPVNSTKLSTRAIEMRYLPKDGKKDNATSEDIFRNIGQQGPYFPADDLFPETNAHQSLPEHCQIEQVHILHRHGARYESSSSPGEFGHKINNKTKAKKLKAKGDLAFLNHWNYSMGSQLLVHQGAQENFDSGVRAYYQYAKLLENVKEKPVFRTTSQSRMLDTARYWLLGFFGWDAPNKVNLEVIPETSSGQNNTLFPSACKNGYTLGMQVAKGVTKQWQEKYMPPILKRLQKDINGYNLTTDDLENMFQLCGLETVSHGYSHFCSLFTKKEWESFEYDIDLQFASGLGFMSPTGKAQGIGWVTEFLDRLTNKTFSGPVTTQNSTLDKNSTYFPLKQPIYADFTHDSVITSILAALNFTQLNDKLDPTEPNPHRRYRTSRVTPFGARLVFEVMSCKDSGKSTKYIRSKINEAVVPLDEGQGCEKRKDGLCKLDGFVKNLKRAYNASHFDVVCFGKNGTDFTVTGPVQNGSLNSSQIHSKKH